MRGQSESAHGIGVRAHAQRALAVEEGWTVEELEEHIHQIEHELYPEVVALLAAGRVHVRDDLTVRVDRDDRS